MTTLILEKEKADIQINNLIYVNFCVIACSIQNTLKSMMIYH